MIAEYMLTQSNEIMPINMLASNSKIYIIANIIL